MSQLALSGIGVETVDLLFATGWYGMPSTLILDFLVGALERSLDVGMDVVAVKVVDELESRCRSSLPLAAALLASVPATLAVAMVLFEITYGRSAAPRHAEARAAARSPWLVVRLVTFRAEVPQACLAMMMWTLQKGYDVRESTRSMLGAVAWSSYAAFHRKGQVYLLVGMLGYESGLRHLDQPQALLAVGC
jgi:hypothetical protein